MIGTVRSSAYVREYCRLLFLLLVLAHGAAAAQVLGTAFTYQGELRDQGAPANGSYDLQFRLFDAAVDGTQVGQVQSTNGLAVQGGLFSLTLDFGDQFTGAPRWLELRVRRSGQAGFVILEPRTAITPAPYALHAEFVADNTIVGASIADETITASDIQAGAVDASELAIDAVTSSKIADAAITNVKLAAGAVTGDKIAAGAVGAAQLDAAQVQVRVSGQCIAGEAIRAIQADGSVICEAFQPPQSVLIRTIDDQPNNVGQFNAMVIGSDDLPFIAYYDATATALKVAHCADPNCDNAVVNTLDNSADTGAYAEVAIGASGFPVIGYVQSGTVVGRIALCANAVCNSATFRQHETSAIGNANGHIGIAVGAGGRPIMSFWDISARDLTIGRCTDSVCSLPAFPAYNLFQAGDNGEFTSIAIGSDGLPVVSHFDASATALLLVKCTNDGCTSPQTHRIVDNTADVGRFTSIAIGSDGLPIVSYVDQTAGKIKVAHCDDINCATATLSTISDPSNGLGGDTSIAIGSDGLPIVAYQNTNLATLKVAKCSAPDCSGSSTITTLDDPDNAVGGFNSIAIGADGLPIVSYYDLTAGALKVAKCLAADCR